MNSYFPKTDEPADPAFKALILAGGRGKRFNEFTNEENKCLYNFRGKPLIEYSLENAMMIGITDVIIVVGYLAENIINKYGVSYGNCSIKYVIQREQLGLVNAIECAKRSIGDSDFLLMLGDEFFINPQHPGMFSAFEEKDAFASCGVISVNDRSLISKTYSILADSESRRIYRLIEKPEHPTNNLMGSGNVFFRNEILRYIDKTPINPKRNERELPDLIQCAIDDGKDVYYHTLASEYVNVNKAEDIADIKSGEPVAAYEMEYAGNDHLDEFFLEGSYARTE
jgi:dTDP-glucose pyrophosphorylase